MKEMTHRLVNATEIPNEEIEEYYKEFKEHGEDCYVLYLLKTMSVQEWKMHLVTDTHTQCIAFLVNDKVAGIGRITMKPNHQEAGMFGYAIRPTMRGQRLATKFIEIVSECFVKTVSDDLTACVDIKNAKSLNAFISAGWKFTGRTFEWSQSRIAIELSTKGSKMLYNRF